MIRRLPESVVSRIAAGEVVIGPFSVVKELVENSIDAGANSIEIELRNGGKSYIKVKDNGHGMSKDELIIAVKEHTTSKIEKFEDIYKLSTYGFRGEALSAIARVSRLIITSSSGVESHRLEIIGGRVKSIEEYPHSRGTTIEVYDLFFNVPARRKFLKSAISEQRMVTEIVEKFILSTPQISILYKNEQEIIYHAKTGTLKERFTLVFPEVKEFTEMKGTYVSGIISSPDYYRKNRTGQIFFVQGRYVVDKMLYSVFETGYGEAITTGRHPYGVIFINIPPEKVDVNVHPQKLEVKFSNPKEIYSDIIRTIREAIKTFISKKIYIINEHSFKESQKDYITKNTFKSQQIFQSTKNESEENKYVEQFLLNANQKNIEYKNNLLIIKKRYVLFEGEDGIYIMDFHAAHERILYEELLKNFEKKVDSLNLIVPIKIQAGKSFKELINEKLPDFTSLGFEIKIEKNEILVLSVPRFIKLSLVPEIIQEAVNELQVSEKSSKELRHIIADKACKAAVKTGYDITFEEAQKLIKTVFDRKLLTCPHGRPLFLKITYTEIDKFFERT
ncbi:DNA mismatch repair endonuclease MutL [Thermosipho ferrireducens]|uniref:DNA mismatch repair protein MutL n=1 Tax=Thermosipho ferrireducens TaxID=2571116 RepID=A0ABX7SBC7_9BACT|nr:DNA mismatch repair endonuclease MutL [Thermosipho ferrireducens]QTA38821.1 DNA mismatch repair endonuclease MutL [Thermosipho ferrireducens]